MYARTRASLDGLSFRPARGDCSLATGFEPVDRPPRRILFFFCPSPSGAPERRSIAPQRGWGIRKQGWCDARLPRLKPVATEHPCLAARTEWQEERRERGPGTRTATDSGGNRQPGTGGGIGEVFS
jgi:hypothetical protein